MRRPARLPRPTRPQMAALSQRIARRANVGGTPAPTPYLGPVANRSVVGGLGSANTKHMSTVGFKWTEANPTVQLRIPKFISDNGDSVSGLGAHTFHAAIETGGVFYEILWSGATTVVVPGSQFWSPLSDAKAIVASVGQTAKFHIYTTVSGGNLAAVNYSGLFWSGGGDAAVTGASATDQVLTGGVVDDGSGNLMFALILGMTTKDTVACYGDSTTYGSTGGINTASGLGGEIASLLGSANGVVNCGRSSEKLVDFNKTATDGRLVVMNYCSHAINHYLKNDINLNQSVAACLSDTDTLPMLFPVPKPLIGAPPSPSTNSTNTATNKNTERQAINTAIRAVRPRYSTPVLDVNDVLEVGTTGFWSPASGNNTYSADGLHMTSTAFSVLQAAKGSTSMALVSTAAMPATTFSPYRIKSAKAPIWIDENNSSTSPQGAGLNPVRGVGRPETLSPNVSMTQSATSFFGSKPGRSYASAQGTFANSGNLPAFTNGAAGVTLAALVMPTATIATATSIIRFSNSDFNSRAYLGVTAAGLPRAAGRRLDPDTATNSAIGTTTMAANQPYLLVGVFDAANNLMQIYLNGVLEGSGTFAAGAGNFPATNSGLMGCGAYDGSASSPFVHNQAFAFDKALTTTERQKMEGYMAHLAGCAAQVLPAGHPYLSAPPT